MKPHITTVIFDFGGVLGEPQDQALVAAMASLCRLPVEEFVRLCWLKRSEYDKGTLSSAEYWGEIMGAGGVIPTPELVRQILTTDCMSWTRVNRGTRAWAEELRAAGYRTAILSNMPTDTLAFIRAEARLRWVGEFDATIFSCDYAQIKPDAALFRVCLDRLGVAASECLFVDDNDDNVEAAQALGLTGVRFLSNQETARAVAPYGIPVRSLLGV